MADATAQKARAEVASIRGQLESAMHRADEADKMKRNLETELASLATRANSPPAQNGFRHKNTILDELARGTAEMSAQMDDRQGIPHHCFTLILTCR